MHSGDHSKISQPRRQCPYFQSQACPWLGWLADCSLSGQALPSCHPLDPLVIDQGSSAQGNQTGISWKMGAAHMLQEGPVPSGPCNSPPTVKYTEAPACIFPTQNAPASARRIPTYSPIHSSPPSPLSPFWHPPSGLHIADCRTCRRSEWENGCSHF